jgi:hypothetical protein
MLRRGLVASLAALVVVFVVVGSSGTVLAPAAPHAPRPSGSMGHQVPSREAPPVALKGPPRAILIGGGAEPASTQVSIEQDLALARAILPVPSVLLFASGAHGLSVVESGEAPRPTLRTRLAAFFGARADFGASFRPTRLSPDGPATAGHILDLLERAISMGDDPLLVYWAGHGEQGEDPADNAVRVWGGFPITPLDLVDLLDGIAPHRMFRLVLTTCYGGGFADIVFEGADPAAGPSRDVRCGLFAAPWDDEASGCDPNPDRAAQEGFGLHFLNALRGRDREGHGLPASEVDLDGDGAVSLLEAHARARVRSGGIEVPTTTSERWLRASVADSAEGAVSEDLEAIGLLPEEAWVVERLGEALGLATGAEVANRLLDMDRKMNGVDALLAEAEMTADEAYAGLRIALLERWPTLDDPWRSGFEALLERDAVMIGEALERSSAALTYAAAQRRTLALADEYDRLRVARARVLRLHRAHENLTLAAELRATSGERFARYRALLACERADPFPLSEPPGSEETAQ